MTDDELQAIEERMEAWDRCNLKDAHARCAVVSMLQAYAPGDIRSLLAEVARLREALEQAAHMKTIRGVRVIVADTLGL